MSKLIDRSTSKGIANYLLNYLAEQKPVGVMAAIQRDLKKIIDIEVIKDQQSLSKDKEIEELKAKLEVAKEALEKIWKYVLPNSTIEIICNETLKTLNEK